MNVLDSSAVASSVSGMVIPSALAVENFQRAGTATIHNVSHFTQRTIRSLLTKAMTAGSTAS
jgi:hypothetical protein